MLPQLDSSTFPSQIFWLVVCGLFFVAFIKFSFVPRISGIIESRNNRIIGDLNKAKEIHANVEVLERECDEKITQNKIKARKQMEEQLNNFEYIKLNKISKLNKSFTRHISLIEKEKVLNIAVEKKFQDILLRE
jgi:F0F1-type ATP synthase membrane subunit b/b'